jgi:hypothetical protein
LVCEAVRWLRKKQGKDIIKTSFPCHGLRRPLRRASNSRGR